MFLLLDEGEQMDLKGTKKIMNTGALGIMKGEEGIARQGEKKAKVCWHTSSTHLVSTDYFSSRL